MSYLVESRLHSFNDAKSIILDICSIEDMWEVCHLAVLIDSLWKNRNNVVWNNDREGVSRIGQQAYFNWQDWFLTHEVVGTHNSSHNLAVWRPSNEGWLKCNVDAGFNNHLKTSNKG